jgi:hypothetical protein
MRRLLVLVALLGTACAHERVDAPPPPPVQWASLQPRPVAAPRHTLSATEKERAAAQAYTQALAAPDFGPLAAALDEEAHFRLGGAADVHGRDNVVQAHAALFGAFAERRFVTTRVLVTDSSQSLEWLMTGVHKATHKPIGLKGLTLLWTKDDGSIAHVHLYLDEALEKAQLGLGPESLRSLPAPVPPALPRQVVEQERTPDESANVALVRAALQALADDNEAAYVAAMADDVEVTTLESAAPARGKAAARAYFKSTRGAIGYLATSIENAWGIGPFVVVEYQIVGEQHGPIGWIPAPKDKNKLIKLSLVDVVQIRERRIAHVWRYDDPIQIVATP